MASALRPDTGTGQRMRPLLVELAGPAGAGKSTLSKALVHRLDATTREIWGLPVLPLLANGIQLIPTFSRLWLHSGCLLWEETRHLVRLRTLGRALRRPQPFSTDVMIFDEGPVFALAWLRAFGHEALREHPSSAWWDRVLREWASLIDMVVVLDAPDQVLARRIRGRQHDHEVKAFPDREIARWMAQFREALEWVLAGLSRHGAPVVVRLSSEDSASDPIVERLIEKLSGSLYGR
jgi:predicted ATPase